MTHPLKADWAALVHRRPTARAVARWGRLEPALAGATLDELVERAQATTDDLDQSDRIMAALFRRAGGDPLARRAVLAVITPRLVRVAQRIAADRGTSVEENLMDLAALALHLSCEAEGRWSSHLARRFTLFVHRRYWRARRFIDQPAAEADIGLNLPSGDRDVDDDAIAGLEAGRLLRDALDDGVISPLGARILECVAAGLSTADAAAQLGVNYELAKKTRHRAATALRNYPSTLALRSA